jgi:hypothetical protein
MIRQLIRKQGKAEMCLARGFELLLEMRVTRRLIFATQKNKMEDKVCGFHDSEYLQRK